MTNYVHTTSEGATLIGNVSIIGNVKLDKEVSIWPHAVLRGDAGSIEIGEGTNIQDNCTIHQEWEVNVKIGKDVSIGHNAVVHCDKIGDNVLIGMGAILLSHAIIGSNVLIGAGSLVTENTVIGDGELWFGNPAKFRRMLTNEEIENIKANAEHYKKSAREHKEGKYVSIR